MSLFGRWFSDVIRLALTLAGALLFMQAPALSHDYAAALAQVADSENRDIAGRETTARNYYDLQTTSEANLSATLRDREPSNAAGLDQSLAEASALATALARIEQSLTVASSSRRVWDLLAAPNERKRAIVEQAVRSFAPLLQLSVAELISALAGVVLGSLLGHLLLLLAHRNSRSARSRLSFRLQAMSGRAGLSRHRVIRLSLKSLNSRPHAPHFSPDETTCRVAGPKMFAVRS